MGHRTRALGITLAAGMSALGACTVAEAAIPSSLTGACEQRDAADGDPANGLALPYYFCDDGVPDSGGRQPNVGGVRAVEVPAAYTGPGQPDKDPVAAAQVPGSSAGNVALDVDLSLPDPAAHAMPAAGYPIVVLMHGCCAGSKASWEADMVDAPGEKWHYSNAWFASRGYIVITYTARGFVESGDGSTGETLLDHRSFELNDFQHLAGQVADETFTVGGGVVRANPGRVLATGGSYGGGFAWLALTDPTWRSPGGLDMALAAVAPRYGWSDLAYSLVPNGAHPEDGLPAFDGSSTAVPFGFPKRSIVGGLYATGQQGATFQQEIDEAFLCLQAPVPIESNPLCATVRDELLPSFIANRSAFYQNAFFERLATDPAARVPVFSAGTTTDPLFPGIEHRRMVARLKSVVPDYPVKEYYGDYQHFVQNKVKEWTDVCGPDRSTCELGDYPGGDLDADPPERLRTGATTLLNEFVDHYLEPPANPAEPAPALDVTASLQICPETAASAGLPADEPGERFTAPTFDELAPHTLTIAHTATQTTTSTALPNLHAVETDPLANLLTRGGRCPVHEASDGEVSAGPGVATYDSPPLESDVTMIGPARITVPYAATGSELQLNARLYDLDAEAGIQVLADRGFRALSDGSGEAVIHLLGNGWRFPAGHRIRLELAQDDDPYIKRSTLPSSMTLSGATLELPVREASAAIGDMEPPGPQDPGGTPDEDGSSQPPGDDESADEGGDQQEPGPAEERAGGGGSGGSLPFTGIQALGLLLAALGLTSGGAALRRAVSRRTSI